MAGPRRSDGNLRIDVSGEADLQRQTPCTLSRSLDGGATWVAPEFEPPLNTMGTLLFDPVSMDTVYFFSPAFQSDVSDEDVMMFRSVDRGATWQNITGGIKDLIDAQVSVGPDRTLYACSQYGVYRWVPPAETTAGTAVTTDSSETTETTESASTTSIAEAPGDSFRRGGSITHEGSESYQRLAAHGDRVRDRCHSSAGRGVRPQGRDRGQGGRSDSGEEAGGELRQPVVGLEGRRRRGGRIGHPGTRPGGDHALQRRVRVPGSRSSSVTAAPRM